MKYIAYLIATLLGCFLVSEILLRLVGFTNTNFYQYSNCCGSQLRPNSEGVWNKEGRDYVIINSDGLRDREHELEKPSDVYRIVVLGDSYAEALQLPQENSFWGVLEKELNKTTGKKIEVINFGVSGYGTAQQLLTLRHRALKYQPDLVLLAFLTGNDIRNNHEKLEQDSLKPYFVLESGQLRFDDSFREEKKFKRFESLTGKFLFWSLEHFRTLQLANSVRQLLKSNQVADNTGSKNIEVGLDNHIYFPDARLSTEWLEAWRVTFKLISLMRDETQTYGADFLMVILSNGIQVHPDESFREQFMREREITNLFLPDEKVVRFAEENGINSLMLSKSLQKWTVKTNQCVHGFENSAPCGGHWNEFGHKLAGELMTEYIQKNIPID